LALPLRAGLRAGAVWPLQPCRTAVEHKPFLTMQKRLDRGGATIADRGKQKGWSQWINWLGGTALGEPTSAGAEVKGVALDGTGEEGRAMLGRLRLPESVRALFHCTPGVRQNRSAGKAAPLARLQFFMPRGQCGAALGKTLRGASGVSAAQGVPSGRSSGAAVVLSRRRSLPGSGTSRSVLGSSSGAAVATTKRRSVPGNAESNPAASCGVPVKDEVLEPSGLHPSGGSHDVDNASESSRPKKRRLSQGSTMDATGVGTPRSAFDDLLGGTGVQVDG
jgi:hypothetical protein